MTKAGITKAITPPPVTDAEKMIEAGAHILRMSTPAILRTCPAALAERIYLAMNKARPTQAAPDDERPISDATRRMERTLGAEFVMNAPADEDAELVVEALRHAKATFYRYAKLHRAKCTDEGDKKACDNASMGEEMDRALSIASHIARLPDGLVTEAQVDAAMKAFGDTAIVGQNFTRRAVRAALEAALSIQTTSGMREALRSARPYVEAIARGDGTVPEMVVAEATLGAIDAALVDQGERG